MSSGLKVSWYAYDISATPEQTQAEGYGDYNYYYTMYKGESQNIYSLSFPSQIENKSRDFYIRLTLEDGTTAPTFPANVQYEVPVPQVSTGTTVLHVTETQAGKFLVRDLSPLTTAQKQAINSGITAAKVTYYDNTLSGLEDLIESI